MRLASVYSVEAEERGSSWFDPWWVGSPCRWLSGWMVPIFSPYLLCIIFPFSRKKKEKEKERNQCFSILDQISVASATPKSIKCCRGHQTLKAVIQKCPHCSRAHKHDGNNCKFWSSPPTPLPPNAFKSLRQFQKFVEKKKFQHSFNVKNFNDSMMNQWGILEEGIRGKEAYYIWQQYTCISHLWDDRRLIIKNYCSTKSWYILTAWLCSDHQAY